MEQRIGALHVNLENEFTEAKIHELRGRIKALREMLALDNELPPGQ